MPLYNTAKSELMKGTFNLAGADGTMKVMLVNGGTNGNAAALDTYDFRSDVTNEATGTGYTAGGQNLTSMTVTTDTTNDRGVWDAADVTWAASTITATGAVIYKNVGSAATDNVLAYIDFGGAKSSSSGNFTIQWSTSPSAILLLT